MFGVQPLALTIGGEPKVLCKKGSEVFNNHFRQPVSNNALVFCLFLCP